MSGQAVESLGRLRDGRLTFTRCPHSIHTGELELAAVGVADDQKSAEIRLRESAERRRGRLQRDRVRFRFGNFELDAGAQLLRRGDEVVALTPKAFQLLALLLGERPAVVTKGDIQEALWPETYVVEANTPNLVAEIRTALGDSARDPKYIRTSHGIGYAFCGTAFAYGPQASSRLDEPTACALAGQGRMIWLRDGEHLLGRSSECAVRLAGAAISRRHAVVRVRRRSAVIEDLQSSNGTRVQGRRITGPVPLSAGDRIRIGDVTLRFVVFDPIATTDEMTPVGVSGPIDVGHSTRPRRILGRS